MQVLGAWCPKEIDHWFSPTREFDSTNFVYVLRSESESEDDDMCLGSDDEGPTPNTSNRISRDDWDEKEHTSLHMCAK